MRINAWRLQDKADYFILSKAKNLPFTSNDKIALSNKETTVFDFPFLNDLEPKFAERLKKEATIKELPEGTVVTSQYDLAEDFFLLIEGDIRFYLKVEHEMEELLVGTGQRPFTPVGWSGFKEPYRYATTVKCSSAATFLTWKHEVLRDFFEAYSLESIGFLQFIVKQTQLMLMDIWQLLATLVPPSAHSLLDLKTFSSIEPGISMEPGELLRRSPFFEVFDEDDLAAFVDMGIKNSLDRGQILFRQGTEATTFDIHMHGKVALIYALDKEKLQFDRRVVRNGGYLISSNCFTADQLNYLTCVALAPSTVFRLDAVKLSGYLEQNPGTGVSFYLRLLWFYSNRLRSARAKLIRINFDGEVAAVKNMIEQNCTQLEVTSKLHKVPHLLSSRYTLNDALVLLRELSGSGYSLEKRIARATLEILTEVGRENDFYTGLLQVYSGVVNASPALKAAEVRKESAVAFLKIFDEAGYTLSGWENLPDEPCIFIYNHLENHAYNTLPNSFQLTLDSHFISSVILFQKYGDPGVRVVRIPRGEEYGHQYYYERLGHISVYTLESGGRFESPEMRRIQRDEFYEQAAFHLENGTSIMVAPEGTSYSTENSPGIFKPGAFLLAAKMKKEPFIVPVAVANFDKRINRTTFGAVIKKPFKISEKLSDPSNRDEMNAFLLNYQKTFRTYIEEAVALANENPWLELLSKN